MRVHRPPRGTLALVSLGSNIAPRDHLARAVSALAERAAVEAVSGVWRSAAVGRAGPDYLNGAVRLRTPLDAVALKFEVLRAIEADLGRVRSADKDAPRTIDLDLAVFGDAVVDAPDGHGGRLRLPDPDIARHAHIALPLADVAGELRLPGDGRSLSDVAAAAVEAAVAGRRPVPIRVADLDRSPTPDVAGLRR